MTVLLKRCAVSATAVVLALAALLGCDTAFAKSNYVDSDFCEEYYWSSVDGFNVDNSNGFSGFVKYICDDADGAFYLYFSFYDQRINPQSTDKITIGFTVENSAGEYLIAINENGYASQSSPNVQNKSEIYYSFKQASAKRGGGTLYVGFRLKDADDRKTLNNISCEYFFGKSISESLIEGVTLDMTKPEATKKPTATKPTTTKKSTTAKGEKYTASATTKARETQQASTKFAPQGGVAVEGSNGTKKYEYSQSNTQGSKKYVAENGAEQAQETVQEQSLNEQTYNYPDLHSRPAKAAKILGVIILTAGLICMMVGIFSFKTKQDKTDHTTPDDKE